MKNNLVITVVLVVLVGTGAFFGGTKYQQSKDLTGRFANFQGARNGQLPNGRNDNSVNGGNGQNFRPVNGQIISSDDKSITVKMQDGSTKIVILTDSTTFNKTSEGSKSDLKVGDAVAAFGNTNSDGSLTAQSVQLNPILRMNQNGQQ